MFSSQDINFFVAFLAGVVSFLAPCVLSIVPVQASVLFAKEKSAFLNGLAFVGGFLLVFIVFGLLASSIGVLLSPYRILTQRLGGALLIFLGLYVLGFFRSAIFYRQFKFNIDATVAKSGKLIAFLIGVSFGFSWTPCIGPTLAVILFWASQAETFWKGFWLLIAYGAGLVVPFLVLSLMTGIAFDKLSKLKRVGYFLHWIMGVLIMFVGLLLLFDKLGVFIGYTLAFGAKVGF